MTRGAHMHEAYQSETRESGVPIATFIALKSDMSFFFLMSFTTACALAESFASGGKSDTVFRNIVINADFQEHPKQDAHCVGKLFNA